MKNVIQKILLIVFLTSITCLVIEILLRQIPNDYRYKRSFLEINSDSVEILFLGGSHANAGCNPEFTRAKGFNAAHASQSLDYDFEILKKYSDKLSNLEFIVLPISYGTLFSKIDDSSEPWRAKNYTIYYNIYITKYYRYYTEILNGLMVDQVLRLYRYYVQGIDEIKCSDLGFGLIYTAGINGIDHDQLGFEAASRHTIETSEYYDEMVGVLDSIVKFSKKHSCRLILLTTPAYKSYREHMKEDQWNKTEMVLEQVVKSNENCYYFNLLNDSNFTLEDFGDADHLNKEGAKKLTLKIDSIIVDIKHKEYSSIITPIED